ncbi:MAG: AAA family ATPase [Burkholderiales bacterium]|nr:AAA family ATPase [Burkholderiales bacterium]
MALRQVAGAAGRPGCDEPAVQRPPGSGKTELAHQLAGEWAVDWWCARPADLHSKWYGESEGRVRRCSRAATRRAVLLIDEADALLGAREVDTHRADAAVLGIPAPHGDLPGLLICATNRGRSLDSALMRRFVFRLPVSPAELRAAPADARGVGRRGRGAGAAERRPGGLARPAGSAHTRRLCQCGPTFRGAGAAVRSGAVVVRAAGRQDAKPEGGARAIGFVGTVRTWDLPS